MDATFVRHTLRWFLNRVYDLRNAPHYEYGAQVSICQHHIRLREHRMLQPLERDLNLSYDENILRFLAVILDARAWIAFANPENHRRFLEPPLAAVLQVRQELETQLAALLTERNAAICALPRLPPELLGTIIDYCNRPP
jgi:hypothetical protein